MGILRNKFDRGPRGNLASQNVQKGLRLATGINRGRKFGNLIRPTAEGFGGSKSI